MTHEKQERIQGQGGAKRRAACGATTDVSNFACVLPKDHDLSDKPQAGRHDNGAGLTWSSMRRALLDAAAPELADEGVALVGLLSRIVEFSHYATDDDTTAEVLARIENDAREVAKIVGYDGNASAARRKAGRE